MKTVRRNARILSAVAAWAMVQSPLAAMAACPGQPEREAHQVRLLQTELMVAALSCKHGEASAYGEQYNAFVTKFRGPLKQNAAVLKAEYRRSYGAKHEAALDRYVTQIANAASERSLHLPNYCLAVGPLFDQVLALKASELGGFSQRLTFGQDSQAKETGMACAAGKQTAQKPSQKP
jgi:hypothetical protein